MLSTRVMLRNMVAVLDHRLLTLFAKADTCILRLDSREWRLVVFTKTNGNRH